MLIAISLLSSNIFGLKIRVFSSSESVSKLHNSRCVLYIKLLILATMKNQNNLAFKQSKDGIKQQT